MRKKYSAEELTGQAFLLDKINGEGFETANRELIEEIGDKAQIEISRSIGIFHIPKKDVYWVMVIYFGLYKGGDIKVMEPEKCLGYKWFSLEQALSSPKVTNSCKFLIQNICQLEEIKRD